MARTRAAGVAHVRLGDADRKSLQDLAGGVGREWAKELDRRGREGGKVVEAFARALPR